MKTDSVELPVFNFVKFSHNNYARQLVGSLISNRYKNPLPAQHSLNDAPTWPSNEILKTSPRIRQSEMQEIDCFTSMKAKKGKISCYENI